LEWRYRFQHDFPENSLTFIVLDAVRQHDKREDEDKSYQNKRFIISKKKHFLPDEISNYKSRRQLAMIVVG